MEGIVWKISVYPSHSNLIKGFVEKLVDGETQKSIWVEARATIKGNFTGVEDVLKQVRCDKPFPAVCGGQTAFTLRAKSFDEKNVALLKTLQNINKTHQIKKIHFAVETSPLKPEQTLTCVYGLLTIVDGEVSNLYQCVELILEAFPDDDIKDYFAWMSYCTDEHAWRSYAKIGDVIIGHTAWNN
ncbi:unnamed protein product [Clavelina lepadiformis]|uniref:Uncharacterized protein n=1 Tax=Clavelina lepadiformis TaxID=159417 RepID=A0ABP0GC45_CLALP